MSGIRFTSDQLKATSLQMPTEPSIRFVVGRNKEVLRLESNGDIYVNEKLVENDKEVVYGMKSLLQNYDSFWKRKHDELGKEWATYTDEWQKTLEVLESESLEKDKKIKELEEYKFMYESLNK